MKLARGIWGFLGITGKVWKPGGALAYLAREGDIST